MGRSPKKDFEEDLDRIADNYFNLRKINKHERREDAAEEFLTQLGSHSRSAGIFTEIKGKYNWANDVFKRITGKPLPKSVWKGRDEAQFLSKFQAFWKAKTTGEKAEYYKREGLRWGVEKFKSGMKIVVRDENGRFAAQPEKIE